MSLFFVVSGLVFWFMPLMFSAKLYKHGWINHPLNWVEK